MEDCELTAITNDSTIGFKIWRWQVYLGKWHVALTLNDFRAGTITGTIGSDCIGPRGIKMTR